jgi:transcriptional regulator with XRE-family HTH domain
MADAEPNGMRRRLGTQLKTLRAAKGLTLMQAASALELPGGSSALSKIENGRQQVPLNTLASYFHAYGVTDAAVIEEITATAKMAKPGRRNTFDDHTRGLSAPFANFVNLEAMATKAEVYFDQLIPGLLQTPEYAKALVRGARDGTREEQERTVEVRLERQKVLVRENPLSLWCVIDEAALWRRVGGASVMRGQLERLIEVIDDDALPHVNVQVMPFSVGAHAGMNGGFTLLHFAAGPPVAVEESRTTSLYLEEPDTLAVYESAFAHMCSEALGQHKSMALISKLIKDLYS